jgi:hypothetical protein
MTDTDFLAEVRRAEAESCAQRMSKTAKASHLRQRGWRRASSTGTERWVDQHNGVSATLAGACVIQLLRDLEAGR